MADIRAFMSDIMTAHPEPYRLRMSKYYLSPEDAAGRGIILPPGGSAGEQTPTPVQLASLRTDSLPGTPGELATLRSNACAAANEVRALTSLVRARSERLLTTIEDEWLGPQARADWYSREFDLPHLTSGGPVPVVSGGPAAQSCKHLAE